ncbi:MAG: hypothetical protein KF799_05790 [Bdellovibrionales bacterium]|nr:hypothetical protein [Bdellovibrionales bacterium]
MRLFARLTLLCVTLGAGVFAFQACKPVGSAMKANVEQSSGDPNAPRPIVDFRAGDTFRYYNLPYPSSMMEKLLSKWNYENSTSTRAVAIAQNGLGYVSILAGAQQMDVDKMALEGCYALSRLPCALVARGVSFALNSADLDSSFTYQFSDTTTMSAAAIPFVNPPARASLLTIYQARTSPKAMAVSVDGVFTIADSDSGTALESDAEAKRLALERCELTAMIVPCTLVFVNDTVAFKGKELNAIPATDYTRTVIADSIPGLRAAHFATYFTAGYLLGVDAAANVAGAVYIANNGAMGAAYSNNPSTDVAQQALSDCQASAGSGVSCVRYGTGKNVSATAATLLPAIFKGSLDVHCAVPRVDCSAHAKMGCPGGKLYSVVTSGVIEYKACP